MSNQKDTLSSQLGCCYFNGLSFGAMQVIYCVCHCDCVKEMAGGYHETKCELTLQPAQRLQLAELIQIPGNLMR